ncbi:hypothetical protein EZS27_009932 [termite gut metagenome]|uniref:Uncharacterized protein n=1 Tax=termite gut metagenome TaxID=433724 RepID=A0A5J4SAN7_9ZZZZ
MNKRFLYSLLQYKYSPILNEIASNISNFEDFVDNYILKKDDSVFQFSNPYSVSNIFSDIDMAIKNYKEILFPVVKNRSNGKKTFSKTYYE